MATLLVVSDIHYASAAEQARRGYWASAITNPLLRAASEAYRHFIWLRDPLRHNHLLEKFLDRAGAPDLVVAKGDYSCDSAFVGVSDEAAFQSAQECLDKLRRHFGEKLLAICGDHEFGKQSLFGGAGGLRWASWRRATGQLGLRPFWRVESGRYVFLGVTSTLIALPVFAPEILKEERALWEQRRAAHLAEIRSALNALQPEQRVILFCHDPSALPFLWHDESIRRRLQQVEQMIIGHLHSPLILWKSRRLAGMPAIPFLGDTVRRLSTALREAGHWRDFKVRLCPRWRASNCSRTAAGWKWNSIRRRNDRPGFNSTSCRVESGRLRRNRILPLRTGRRRDGPASADHRGGHVAVMVQHGIKNI